MFKKARLSLISTAIVTQIVFSQMAYSQTVSNLNDAITRTVIDNPEVRATWFDFQASIDQQRVASGGFRPSVDLVGEAGVERSETPSSVSDTYNRSVLRLTLTQLLFDGFETRNEVKRLGYASLSRFYEVKQASERTALEAAQAYMDVLRFQKLVDLAKKNYVSHKRIHNDITQRSEAGISRRVDLEQASGRLALAESNLLTEITNLHDVTVRFQRLTHSLPAEQLDPVDLPTQFISDDRQTVLDRAYVNSPVINTAIENFRAAQTEVKVANAAFFPRLDLRARKEIDRNTDGIRGNFDEEGIEVVLTYNLYNGGSDLARKNQLNHQMDSARELRLMACDDVRQQVSIAYNDINSLEEQVDYLHINQEAIFNARAAYREQFDIGQRTLLDLLDTENEFFEVQRAYQNATYDLLLAQVRTLSGMGLLLDALGLQGREAAALEYIDIARESDADIGGSCPKGVASAITINKETLLASVFAEAEYEQSKPANASNIIRVIGVAANPVIMNVKVNFEYKSTSLNNKSIAALDDAATVLRQNPNSNAIVAGHTDSIAPQDYNIGLSQERANIVREALINDYGIDASRLRAIGYGETNPIADNATAEGRSKNRRVELILDIDK